jgi:hypothetical protein
VKDFKKSDHENWTMEKDHLPWTDFVVHGVYQPLVHSILSKWEHQGAISKKDKGEGVAAEESELEEVSGNILGGPLTRK